MTKQEFYTFIATPRAKWPENISLEEQLKQIRDCVFITETMRSIPYTDFLQTPYWQTVSQYLHLRAPDTCVLCGNPADELELFRRSAYGYAREYSSHDYGDFITLCPRCHKKIQKYIPEIQKEVEFEIKNIIKAYK